MKHYYGESVLYLALIFALVTSSATGTRQSACELSVNELLSMDPIHARNILLSLYENTCLQPDYDVLPEEDDYNSREIDDGSHFIVEEDLSVDQSQLAEFYKIKGLATQQDAYFSHGSEPLLQLSLVYSKQDNVNYNDPAMQNKKDNRNNLVDQLKEIMKIYNSTNGVQWLRRSGWATQRPICLWYGIECDKCRTQLIEQNRCPVISIQLQENGLKGNLPDLSLPYVTKIYLHRNELTGDLPRLDLPSILFLTLDENRLQGTIPNLDTMANLVYLGLSSNQFEGTIPNFSHLVQLRELWLSRNRLIGNIPTFKHLPLLEYLILYENRLSETLPNFEDLTKLQYIVAYSNLLSGTIPLFENSPILLELHLPDNKFSGPIPSFDNLLNLQYLDLATNHLDGSIPNFRSFYNLQHLVLYSNKFSGAIPDFGDLRSLQYMILYSNQFTGDIPNFSSLLLLRELWLSDNKLTGTIPVFDRLASLTFLDLTNNLLSGAIPGLRNLTYLEYLILYNCQLHGSVPNFDSLSLLKELWLSSNKLIGNIPEFNNLSVLEYLYIDNNLLKGSLPRLEKHYRLRYVDLSENMFSGTVPNFSNLLGLYEFSISNNQINGTVPDFSSLISIRELWMSNNQLSGTIPGFAHLHYLEELNLKGNLLTGHIPNFYGCDKLLRITLSENQLNGSLPLLRLNELIVFDIRSNNIFGSIPEEFVGNKLELLDLSHNQLNGTIPQSIEGMRSLKFVHLNHNQFSGSIPARFWNLKNLFVVDLSHNRFSGDVNEFITPINVDVDHAYHYKYLDLENNQISGRLGIWIYLDVHQVYTLNLKNNLLTGLDDLPINRLWKKLDLSYNPIESAIPESYKMFSQMEYLDLRFTFASHRNNSLIPGFSMPTRPYNLRDDVDLFICPSILAMNSSAQTQINIDPDYYGMSFCRCLPNYFGFAGKCVLCPSDCDCNDGVSLSRCHVSPNLTEIKMVISCPRPLSCQMKIPYIDPHAKDRPAIEQSCEVGYTDRACSRCDEGYGRQGYGCIKCNKIIKIISTVVGTGSLLAFVTYIYKWSTGSSGTTKIMIFHLQTLPILSTVWTGSRGMDQFIEWPYMLGSLHMPNLGCVLGSTNHVDSIMFSVLRVPIVLIVGVTLFFLLTSQRDKVVYVTLNVLLLFSYNIARDVFGVFGCTVYDQGTDVWYLNVAPWIQCNPASAEMQRLLQMAIPIFVTYVVGLPLGLMILLKRRKPDDESHAQRVGFLYKAYKEECWYWELVVMVRRLLFSFATSVLPYTKQGIFFFVLVVVIQTSIWLQHLKKPYKSDLDNKMEIISLQIIFLSFIVALLANMFGSEVWMSTFIIGINIGTFIYFLAIGFLLPWYQDRKLTREVNPMNHQSRLSTVSYSGRVREVRQSVMLKEVVPIV